MNLSDIAAKLKELAESILKDDAGEKAVWDTAYVNDLPNSAFLFVEPGDDDASGKRVPRSKRHFPYKDASGKVDMPHLRNAIARIPQSNAPGLDKAALQKRAQAMLERMNQGSKGSLAVYKQADGAYRWFGWVSNHFRDNDRPREIISGKAHMDFVSWADKEQKYPELWLWHVPGSKVGVADWLEFADGFLMSSGTFDKGKEGIAERLAAADEPLTMSHGFYRLKAMDGDGVTDAYRMFEASILPQGAEANPWTRFGAIKEADMPISEAKKAFLAKYLDAETITKLEGDTEGLRKAAESAGVDWKDVEGAEVPPVPEAVPAEPTVDVAALTASVADALVERLQMKELSALVSDIKAQTDGVPDLVKRLAALEGEVKGLKADDDQKMAAKMAPKVAEVFAWANYRPSQSKETALKEGDETDEKLKAAKPTAISDFLGAAMSAVGKGG